MGKTDIKGKDLKKIGFEEGRVIGVALNIANQDLKQYSKGKILDILAEVLSAPDRYMDDPILGAIADALTDKPTAQTAEIALKEEPKEYAIYGAGEIEKGAIDQMDIAIRLPVAVAGALMPDAHQGYGLPIGGVLATNNVVIPFGVGVDIGCRMCLSIFDLPGQFLHDQESKLKRELIAHTLFGAGKGFDRPLDDAVLERSEFKEIPFLRGLHQKAVKQIGTSGSGNHFVEFGLVEILADTGFQVPAGKYLAVLSHSGSRGLGATIANHYTKIAMGQTPLPKQAKHLAWLGMDTEAGQEYWQAMNLAGDYASACHHQIHQKLASALSSTPLAVVENHHNFAWKEQLHGKEVIMHRKGATPAGKGVLGIIPGSMTAPGFIVRGKGEGASLQSASHGAGRRMSRTQAKKSINQREMNDLLKAHDVMLIGGGLDEAPMAYKNIHMVMDAQKDLVDVLGKFYPKIVRMDQ